MLWYVDLECGLLLGAGQQSHYLRNFPVFCTRLYIRNSQFIANKYPFSLPFPSFLAIFCLKFHVHISIQFLNLFTCRVLFLVTAPVLLTNYAFYSASQLLIEHLRCDDRYNRCHRYFYHYVSMNSIVTLLNLVYLYFIN